jgi:hypothetical protein
LELLDSGNIVRVTLPSNSTTSQPPSNPPCDQNSPPARRRAPSQTPTKPTFSSQSLAPTPQLVASSSTKPVDYPFSYEHVARPASSVASSSAKRTADPRLPSVRSVVASVANEEISDTSSSSDWQDAALTHGVDDIPGSPELFVMDRGPQVPSSSLSRLPSPIAQRDARSRMQKFTADEEAAILEAFERKHGKAAARPAGSVGVPTNTADTRAISQQRERRRPEPIQPHREDASDAEVSSTSYLQQAGLRPPKMQACTVSLQNGGRFLKAPLDPNTGKFPCLVRECSQDFASAYSLQRHMKKGTLHSGFLARFEVADFNLANERARSMLKSGVELVENYTLTGTRSDSPELTVEMEMSCEQKLCTRW